MALIYLMLARAVVATVAGWDAQGTAAQVLQGITNPILTGVRAITPAAVPRPGVLALAVVWLFALLFLLVYVLAILGARPLWM